MGEFRHTIVNIPVHHVGKPLLNQGSDHLNDIAHMLGYPGIYIGPFNIKLIQVGKISGYIPVGNLFPGCSFIIGGFNNFVVDIGKILHMKNLKTLIFQIPFYNVPGNKRPGIADMRMIVRSYPADIQADFARLSRDKIFFSPDQGIIVMVFEFLLKLRNAVFKLGDIALHTLHHFRHGIRQFIMIQIDGIRGIMGNFLPFMPYDPAGNTNNRRVRRHLFEHYRTGADF